jgi:hypothetical protein
VALAGAAGRGVRPPRRPRPRSRRRLLEPARACPGRAEVPGVPRLRPRNAVAADHRLRAPAAGPAVGRSGAARTLRQLRRAHRPG